MSGPKNTAGAGAAEGETEAQGIWASNWNLTSPKVTKLSLTHTRDPRPTVHDPEESFRSLSFHSVLPVSWRDEEGEALNLLREEETTGRSRVDPGIFLWK